MLVSEWTNFWSTDCLSRLVSYGKGSKFDASGRSIWGVQGAISVGWFLGDVLGTVITSSFSGVVNGLNSFLACAPSLREMIYLVFHLAVEFLCTGALPLLVGIPNENYIFNISKKSLIQTEILTNNKKLY